MNRLLKNKKSRILLFALILPTALLAQNSVGYSQSYFSNELFLIMLSTIILLGFVIAGLSASLKNLSQSDFLIKELKKEDEDNSSKKNILPMILALCTFALSANAANSNDWTVSGIDMPTFYFMLAIIILELFAIGALVLTMRSLLKQFKPKKIVQEKEKSIFELLNASVEIENESEIMMDHDYDGIKELDNDLPPWWKYGFYLTVFIGFIYLIHFHVIRTGDLQATEYNKEVTKAKEEIAEYMRNAAANVDETTVKMMEGSDLETGKQLFFSTCASCHGKLGEGGVGPNLTDTYWLHGGGLVDIFKTVKYGWPDKGMKSWKEELSPIQMAQVSSFIRTLIGSNPPNGKAPQGDPYVEQTVVADSTAVKIDSASVSKPDSISVSDPNKK